MNCLQLNATAFIRVQAQLRLNGTFQHRLMAENPRRSVLATVVIEQGPKTLLVEVTHNGTRNSVTLDRQRRDNATRAARFIEATVNGDAATGLPEMDGDSQISDVDLVLLQAIRYGSGTYQLPADELEPELVISRNPHGSYIAQIRLEHATSMVILPTDKQHAHARLAEHLQRFLNGYRDSLAAAA